MIEQNTSNLKLLSFQQAKELAKALSIKSFEEWVEFYKSGKFESKLIPLYPEHVYAEWKGWDDFFNLTKNEQTNEKQETLKSKKKKRGTNRKDFLSYEEAKEYLKNKGLTFGDWREYCKNKPDYIPSDPYNQYRNSGWVDWYDFLNYKNKSKKFIENFEENELQNKKKTRIYLSYEKAKEFLKDKGLKNCDWKEYARTCPSFIPKNPYNVYRYKGWVNWQDFLSYTGKGKKNIMINDHQSNKITENESTTQKIKQNIGSSKAKDSSKTNYSLLNRIINPFKKLFDKEKLILQKKNEKEFEVRKNALENKITSVDKELHILNEECKSLEATSNFLIQNSKLDNMLEKWASLKPNEEKELIEDLNTLLYQQTNTENKDIDSSSPKEQKYISEKGLRALLTLFDIKTYAEYMEFRDMSPRKEEMPLIPHKFYNNWEEWQSFFNREQTKKVNIKVKNNKSKVNVNVKEENKPSYTTLHPTKNYLDELATKLKNEFSKDKYNDGKTYYYVSYQEAKKFAKSLNLKSSDEWNIIKEDLPNFIPQNPDMEYKEFESWEDFLGYEPKPILPKKNNDGKTLEKPKEKIPPIKYTMNKDGTVSVLSRPPLKAIDEVEKKLKELSMQFEMAKEIVKKFNFKNEHEYKAYLFKPKELPQDPEKEFEKKGWVDWEDFLGLTNDDDS